MLISWNLNLVSVQSQTYLEWLEAKLAYRWSFRGHYKFGKALQGLTTVPENSGVAGMANGMSIHFAPLWPLISLIS